MLLLVTNLHEKRITESQEGRYCGSALMLLFVISTHVTTLLSCYNFALMLHEKFTCFQPIRFAKFFHVYFTTVRMN